jgi:Fe-S cluster assembly protein SufD
MTENTKSKKRKITINRDGKSKDFSFSKEMIPNFANGKPQPKFLTEYREKAWETFKSMELPTVDEEPWRRTDIRKIKANSYVAPTTDEDYKKSIPADILSLVEEENVGGQILMGPGKTSIRLNDSLLEKGVIFTDFETASQQHAEIFEKVLGSLVDTSKDKFSGMAGAFTDKGILLYVPKNVSVEETLHSLLWGPGGKAAYFSHLLIWVEDGAKVTYVHESASPHEDEQSFHAGIVEIHVGEAAKLNFVELQSWGNKVWNFSHEKARIEKDGKLDWIFGAVGSHLTKNFTDIDLIGKGAEGRMSGFYFTDGTQHLDHDTQQNHMAPNTTSDLLFKGALKNDSRSVWQGMIYVAPDAQQTDGYQSNPNLILDDTARADSIPGLEILADDVRCTHGATMGNIDETEVFYLNSRGIPRNEAEQLIVTGFFDPILQRIPFEAIRNRIQQAIVDKLNNSALK